MSTAGTALEMMSVQGSDTGQTMDQFSVLIKAIVEPERRSFILHWHIADRVPFVETEQTHEENANLQTQSAIWKKSADGVMVKKDAEECYNQNSSACRT
jgi:hypothetical protein